MKPLGPPSILAAVLTALPVSAALPQSPSNPPPDGYRQIIERGRISSIDAPVFIPAARADIRPETWVFGVVVGDQPRAYALNLLNHHEIVNDSVGGQRFAAVW